MPRLRAPSIIRTSERAEIALRFHQVWTVITETLQSAARSARLGHLSIMSCAFMRAFVWHYANGVKMGILQIAHFLPQGDHCTMIKRAHSAIGSMPDRAEVADRLRVIREVLNLKSSELADQLRCDRGSWSKIEKGERDLPFPVAWRLYRLYGFSPDYVFDGKVHGIPGTHFETILNQM